jgi:Uma2 family endonuclease
MRKIPRLRCFWISFTIKSMNARVPFAAEEVKRFRINVEQYHRMGEAGAFDNHPKVQLIEGEILEMSPVGAWHVTVTELLARHFRKAEVDGLVVRVQAPLALSDESEPEPGIAIVRGRLSDFRAAHPTANACALVIEVAQSTLNTDQTIKAPLYAKHGIPEYWIVDTQRNVIEQYTRPENGKYRDMKTFDAAERCAPVSLPQYAVTLAELLNA